MFIRSMTIFALATALAAAPLDAQNRKSVRSDVPPGHRPPAGMCRIWIDGVPPGQQPAPTSCAEAVRNRPVNGRVIFGSDDDGRRGGEWGRGHDGGCYVTDARGRRKKTECRADVGRRRSDDDDHRDGRRGRGSDDDDDDARDNRRRDRANTCVDANRDGRCDVTRPDPARGQWPAMIGAVLIERGERTGDVARWLGTAPVTARYVDANGNGVPERATWRNSRGQVVQVWFDTDGDGRADRVDYYEGGRLVRSVKP